MTSTRSISQGYGKTVLAQSASFAAIAVCLLALGGCSTTPPTPAYTSGPWDAHYPHSQRIASAHYEIYTDLDDAQTIGTLVMVMEDAHEQYRKFCPPLPENTRPLRCYVFAQRGEWASFTSRNAGADAPIYLQIGRGAYTVDDWFVAYWLGDQGTYAVAAHEGWHQFVTRHFAAKLPPALEEGIACMFENVQVSNSNVEWSPARNAARQEVLANAFATKTTISLSELIRMHAGEVIGSSRDRISTFYAESWALAIFLTREQSPYRAQMDRYFADLAAGTVYRPTRFTHLKLTDWNPGLSRAQLEYYLGTSLEKLDRPYQEFCRQLAQE